MISQIILLVIATAACVNAYPLDSQVANDLAAILDQLDKIEEQAKLQKRMLCEALPDGTYYCYEDVLAGMLIYMVNQGRNTPTYCNVIKSIACTVPHVVGCCLICWCHL